MPKAGNITNKPFFEKMHFFYEMLTKLKNTKIKKLCAQCCFREGCLQTFEIVPGENKTISNENSRAGHKDILAELSYFHYPHVG